VPGNAGGRPPEEAGQQPPPRPNGETRVPDQAIEVAILEALGNGDVLTLPELAARLEAHGLEVEGGESLVLGQDSAVVLWTRWRPEVIDAVVDLGADGRLVVERCSPERFRGLALDLPVAPVRRPPDPLPEPHWLPALLWRPRRLRESAA